MFEFISKKDLKLCFFFCLATFKKIRENKFTCEISIFHYPGVIWRDLSKCFIERPNQVTLVMPYSLDIGGCDLDVSPQRYAELGIIGINQLLAVNSAISSVGRKITISFRRPFHNSRFVHRVGHLWIAVP